MINDGPEIAPTPLRNPRRPVALVTGAGSGIGAAVALRALADGARVAALDIDAAGLRALAAAAERHGARAPLTLPVDVTDEDAVAGAVARCQEELGPPTRVLANAGIEVNGPAHELPLADWERVLAVNLRGCFLTARHAIRALLDAGAPGSIVCTSSPAAFVGFAGGGNAAYAASKGGISALVRTLALDYAGAGIRVNAVVPGATDTPLLLAGVDPGRHAAARAELVERARAEVPLGRMAEPAEIAGAVAWLWSDDAAYVTGTHLVCDGGLMAKSANTF
jgi:NAD(P)-dependent dehydrogenase (short-subunit alcohol dehydrogenase family)